MAQEQTWKQINKTFWTVFLLASAGLILAVGIVWAFSSLFGDGLSQYPWHMVLWIDLAFVLLAAVLSELAEAPSDPEARSWALGSFVIAVGTLGSLGSHTGKILQGLIESADSGIQDPTILSEIVCVHVGKATCGPIYFGIALALTLVALLIASASAMILRRHSKRGINQPDNPSYYIFIFAAFLFGLYTIVNQRWNTSGPELPAFTRWQFLILALILSILLASYLLVGKAIDITRATVQSMAVSRDSRSSRRESRASTRTGEESRLHEAVLLLIAIAPSALAWAGAAIGLLAVMQTAKFFLVTYNMQTQRLFEMSIWFAYLSIGLLGLLISPILIKIALEVVKRVSSTLKGLVILVGSALFKIVVNAATKAARISRKLVRVIGSIIRREKKPVDVGKASTETGISTELGMGETGGRTRKRRDDWSRQRRSAELKNFLGGVILKIRRALKAILDLASKLMSKGAAAVIKEGVGVSMVVLAALALEYVVTLPQPQPPPSSAAAGKEALRPLDSTSGKAGMPPLQFSRASVNCLLRNPPSWARSEVDGLHGSIESCKVVNEITCVPTTIVVAGTASLPGPAEEEAERARNRGRNLARVLEQNFRNKCGERARVKSYVLNLGRYSRGPLLGEEVRQREVIVLVSRGEDDVLGTAQAVERYASTEAQFAQYSECEFYAPSKGKGRPDLVGKLNCGNR